MSHLCLTPDRGREQAALTASFLQVHYNYSCPQAEEFRCISYLQSFTAALYSNSSMFILSQCHNSKKMFCSILYHCKPLFLKPEIGEISAIEGVWTCPFTPSDQESVQDPSSDNYLKLRGWNLEMFCLHC